MQEINIKKPDPKESNIFLILIILSLVLNYFGMPFLWVFGVLILAFSFLNKSSYFLIPSGVILFLLALVIYILENPFYARKLLIVGGVFILSGIIIDVIFKKENKKEVIKEDLKKIYFPFRSFWQELSHHKKDFLLWCVILLLIYFTKISFLYAGLTVFISYFLIFHFKESVYRNNQFFPYFLVFYLTALLINDFSSNILSDFIDFKFLFVAILSSALLTAFYKEPLRLKEDDLERDAVTKWDYLFITALSFIGGVLVYFKIKMLPEIRFLQYILPILTSAIIAIISFLIIKKKDKVEEFLELEEYEDDKSETVLEESSVEDKKRKIINIRDILVLLVLISMLVFIYWTDKKSEQIYENINFSIDLKESDITLNFRDLKKSHFVYPAVQKLVFEDIIKDNPLESINPDKEAKTGYFLKLFIDSAEIDISPYFEREALIYFEKVPFKSPLYAYALFAFEKKLIDNNFDINAPINFAQVFDIVQKFYTTKYKTAELKEKLIKKIPHILEENINLTRGEVLQITANLVEIKKEVK